jgi:hypothetical protein
MTTLDWNALLEERNAWVARNFPNAVQPLESVLGVNEEFGELNHAHLKEAQHIRGSELKHAGEAMDAVGDFTVYLLGVMNHFSYVPEPWEPHLPALLVDSTDRALLRLGQCVGILNWKTEILDRRPDNEFHEHHIMRTINKLVYYSRRYCELRGWDYNKIVLETWGRVKMRDWIADPVAGGEHTVPIAEQREGFGGIA